MSKIKDVIEEFEAKVKALSVGSVSFSDRTVIAYNEDDLLIKFKQLKSFPAIGIVYEGTRSVSDPTPRQTAFHGLSGEIQMALCVVQQDDSVVAAQAKKDKVIDYLEALRDPFLGMKSDVTGHYYKFLVEAAGDLTKGMVIWIQRWSLPVQLVPAARPPTG